VIELGKFVDTELRKIHDRIFHEEATQGAEFPYAVYNFPNSTQTARPREDFILEIDVWHYSEDRNFLPLETLTDNIDSHMQRLHHYEAGKLQASIYRINRLSLPEPEPNIRRRQLRYQVNTYL